MSFEDMRLKQLVLACVEERLTACPSVSPACMELFRRAFDGCPTSCAMLRALFEPLMRSWIGVRPDLPAVEVLREAFLCFLDFAPQCVPLLKGGDIEPLLRYLRKATKIALLSTLRRRRSTLRRMNWDVVEREEALLALTA